MAMNNNYDNNVLVNEYNVEWLIGLIEQFVKWFFLIIILFGQKKQNSTKIKVQSQLYSKLLTA